MPQADLNLQKANPSGVELDRRIRAVSPFKFPPSLSARHEEELRKRGIGKEFALASGVRTAADNELRELNFQASLPHQETPVRCLLRRTPSLPFRIATLPRLRATHSGTSPREIGIYPRWSIPRPGSQGYGEAGKCEPGECPAQ